MKPEEIADKIISERTIPLRDAIVAAIRAAENDAYEKAAKLCRDMLAPDGSDHHYHIAHAAGCDRCANAILSLSVPQ